MTLISHIRHRPLLAWGIGIATAAVTLVAIGRHADLTVLREAAGAAADQPGRLAAVTAVYALAFLLRAAAWRQVLPGVGIGHALAAIHVSLAGNHVLPLRLGEALRVTSVGRRTQVTIAAATASTITLRAADVVAVLGLALLLAPDLVGGGTAVLIVVAVALMGAAGWWSRRHGVRLPPPAALVAIVVSWLLEAVVIWQAAAWAGAELTIAEAVVVTCVTIAAQVVAIAPGGIGTYEAAATAALVAIGVDAGTALSIALMAHAVKTAYALIGGAIAVVYPAPSLLGRLRLPRRPAGRPAPEATEPGAPVVLFLPALDEEEAVGGVVRRVPAAVCGRPVRCVVIDDGSTDATATVAAAAGAEVVRLAGNQGLGAAVRRGLVEALERGAAVVVFADADGEYAPEELERLVAPIVAGDADYVVGSRFAGDIQRMLPHRRLGNVVLTRWVRWASRLPVTDGQSGYRALSRGAARVAVIAHDFNYAQVLTLDLAGRGFRYAEVPISYRFRETGTSFVRLGRYLRAVVPAVWRTLNPPTTGRERADRPSVLDDVRGEALARAAPRPAFERPVGVEGVRG